MLRGCGAAAHWCTPCVCKRPNRVDNRDSRGDTQHEIGHICKRSHLQEVNCANIMANIDSACQPDSGAGFWVVAHFFANVRSFMSQTIEHATALVVFGAPVV